MSTGGVPKFYVKLRVIPGLSLFDSRPCAVVGPRWLEMSMVGTGCRGPSAVRAVGVTVFATEQMTLIQCIHLYLALKSHCLPSC